MAEQTTGKNELFESMHPARALAAMAVPTIASQLIILIYNLADTWFVGRTGNPYMIGGISLAGTIYLAILVAANVFGVGGAALMARRIGEKRFDDARRVASYSITYSAISAAAISLLTLIFMDPILLFLGASENTMEYGRQYLMVTVVIGGAPSILPMSMPQFLRNAGYSREAGFGVGLGSIVNTILDPIFMFVLLPDGCEVIGAALATLIANLISLTYFAVMFRKVRHESVIDLPHRIERIGRENAKSLFSVGIPSGVTILLFDLVTIVVNRLAASYGDIPLAAMGIVLKLERIPVNVGTGICFGMVPLIAYNLGAGNFSRMDHFAKLGRDVILGFSVACVVVLRLFAEPLVGAFIDNEETVSTGVLFLQGRCLALPFMMIGFFVIYYMNAVNKGIVSFFLSIVRHLVLLIPMMLIMDRIIGMSGLIWSPLAADILGAIVSYVTYRIVRKKIMPR